MQVQGKLWVPDGANEVKLKSLTACSDGLCTNGWNG
jgi:hypothetical protein